MVIRVKKKKNKVTTPNFISFIAYTLILFFGAIILVNMSPNANEDYRKDREERNNKSMKWIFKADDGKEYNIFDTSVQKEHGSAINYDYLMPPTLDEINEISQKEKEEKAKIREEKRQKELLTGTPEVAEIKEGETAFIPTKIEVIEEEEEEQEHGAAPEEQQPIKQDEEVKLSGDVVLQPKNAYNELWDSLEDRSAFLNMVFEYLLSGKLKQLPEGAIRYVVTLYGIDEITQDLVFEERGCMTPWGYELEHGQSVLAYEQRSDSINICNVERRICRNGKLSGSYVQQSCDETLGNDGTVNGTAGGYGTVKKLAYTTYNSVRLDEFIQPPEYAVNELKEFDLDGKLSKGTQTPKMDSKGLVDPVYEEKQEVAQVRDLGAVCKTPWGEKVQPGQFVKAYRFKNGFIDIPCQVQIRTCVDGKLEGKYQFSSCQAWDTSYEDFIYGYMNNEQPAPQRLLKMLQTDLQPNPEYGNNLSSELIDKMLDILKG